MSAVRYLFDEDFNGRIVRGVRRNFPALDTLTVVEAGLSGTPDAEVLAWAAEQQRLLVSHDYRTMRAQAEQRLYAGRVMTGLILIRQDYPIGPAIEELGLITEASTAEEWHGVIAFFPL